MIQPAINAAEHLQLAKTVAFSIQLTDKSRSSSLFTFALPFLFAVKFTSL